MHRPPTVAELSELIVNSAARARPLRLVGRGTWLGGGAPVAPDAEPVHLGAFGGILEYEPGDLTITVGAATTIAELDAVTAAHNQWCPLAPWGGDAGTVGATIATATTGPYAHAMGTPRDLVLGLECVDGTGKVLRPGGKVVKNVAGFDLTRLLTGAWGSLGAITRASLRLRARPAVDETWVVSLHEDVDAGIIGRVDAFARGTAGPAAFEVLGANMSRHVGLAPRPHLLARLSGNAGFVAEARARLSALGATVAVDHEIWRQLRTAETGAASVHRLGTDALGCWVWGTVFAEGLSELLVHCSWNRRVVRIAVPAGGTFAFVRSEGTDATWVAETGATGTTPSAAVRALNDRIKRTFDPANILNPGIMG
ncbi:MAG: FAD-binding protein [Gemmatimonadaceae bacterium]